MAGSTRPLTAQLVVAAGGDVSCTISLRWSDRDIRPYRGLMDASKVRDEVEIVLGATLLAG